jgi:hypothetical protein
MSITTIKRFQRNRHWWWTLEDCNVEVDPEPGTGITLAYHEPLPGDDKLSKHKQMLALGREDALLLRDALNQLFPPQQ